VMAGVPSFISDGPFWGIFLFLCMVVFLRAQGTYWAGWWLRKGATRGAAAQDIGAVAQESDATPEHRPTLRARIAARFSGPRWDRAQAFLERWGFIGVPASFLTIGFQTLVNAGAGFTRMRWDLYTLAMLPGCVAWAAVYATLGIGLLEAWRQSPWLFLGIVAALIGGAWVLTTAWRLVTRRRSAGSSSRTPR